MWYVLYSAVQQQHTTTLPFRQTPCSYLVKQTETALTRGLSMDRAETCINCGHLLIEQDNTKICPNCNAKDIQEFAIFTEPNEDDSFVFIECPGATLYEPGTNDVVEGVDFIDNDDPSKGYRIVERPVFAPTHTRRRRVPREAIGNIRRCQACQDYTIRMRRREGPDFYIPSSKHPGRTKLRSVTHRSIE